MTRITLKIRGEDLKKKLKIQDGVDGIDGAVGEKGQNGKDGIDGKNSKPEEVLPLIEERLPSLGEKIRDGLELLQNEERLNMKAIKGLLETLEKLEKKKVVYGGGGGGFVAHAPLHESFTMNGTDTSVTLTQAVAAQGNAVIALRYQGNVQDMTTHYTVDGNKISLTFTPEPNSVISVTYLP